MTKLGKFVIILAGLVLVIGVTLALKFFFFKGEEQVFCAQDVKLCSDGSYAGRIPPNCEFAACTKENLIRVFSPKANEKISSPFLITGEARGTWYFEANFPIRLYDGEGKEVGLAVAQAKGDWMTENFVPFEARLIFLTPKTATGTLVFEKDNPSGLPENADELRMPVFFSQDRKRIVELFYYNGAKDRNATGNIKCSKNGLESVEREIPLTATPIQDTIKLLLKGEENLAYPDKLRGVTTEYPLEGFSLVETNLKDDGTLILRFDDPLAKTSGGACRVGILWFQIEATAKQFPEVKKVQFLPEELFQP